MSNLFVVTESFQFTHTGQSQNIQLNKEDQYYYSVNYPSSMPQNLKYRTSMIAPSGTNLQLIIPTSSAHQNCTEGNFLQVQYISLKTKAKKRSFLALFFLSQLDRRSLSDPLKNVAILSIQQ